MSCELALVYKFYPFDPTEHALLRWIRRVEPSTAFFQFPLEARRDPRTGMNPDPAFLDFVRKNRPRQIWVWNNLLNPQELAECKSLGATVVALMNSFVVLHGAHFTDQPSYLAHLRNLDAYFVPHLHDVVLLRKAGVNAIEMPFFYDPERYRPLSRLWVPNPLRNIPVLFIGSVSESAASNRRQVIEALAKDIPVHVITYKNPGLKNVHWHRPTNKATILNWWHNRASLLLNIEDVGETYSPERLNAAHGTSEVPYTERKVFHGNHVFPAMGSGRICLSEHSEPLLRFCQPGHDIVTWRTPNEAAEKAREILGQPERLARMQNDALEKVLRLHTAEIRIREILRQIEGIRQNGAARNVATPLAP
ncbi:MAG: glycosyltransferase family protein [Bdellovibrionota bacterium]